MRQAIEFATAGFNPDTEDELETSLTFCVGPLQMDEAGTNIQECTHCWLTDLAEEGAIPLDEYPTAQDLAKAQEPAASEQDALTSVMLGKKLFSFYCFQDWVNTAQRAWRNVSISSEQTICLDQKGRVLKKGLEFMRADKDGSFPVDVYLALVDDTLRYEAAQAAQPTQGGEHV